MSKPPLRVGVVGLGAAAGQILPVFKDVAQVELGGVADVRVDLVAETTARYDVPGFDSIEALCDADVVDAVWVATPNTLHAQHTIAAARRGKHVICEKPMAVSLGECDAMLEAARSNGVHLVQGHSKIYETPIRLMRGIIETGQLGRVIAVNTWNYNDWLLRPRLASEVDTTLGGGVVYRQGPHQVDIARCLAGGRAMSVRAVTGRWQQGFATEGNYSALLEFEDGVVATLVFNGYGRFEVAELTWNRTEGGRTLPDGAVRIPRPTLPGPIEPSQKYSVAGHDPSGERGGQPFFGLTVVSCELGDLRQSPDGVFVYTSEGRREIVGPVDGGRSAELVELAEAVDSGRAAFPGGDWGKATLEVCLGILESSRTGRDVRLHHQVEMPSGWGNMIPVPA
jgi:phthalate 4,5-cis-dihydrodiol dehydrogenase